VKSITRLLALLLIVVHHPAMCQNAGLDAHEWAKKLADPSDKENKVFFKLIYSPELDSTTTFNFLTQLTKQPAAQSNYFLARYYCARSAFLLKFNHITSSFRPFTVENIREEIKMLLSKAMQLAYETNDDYLTAFVSGIYGKDMYAMDETELAVMYMMNSADIYDKIKLAASYIHYVILGETLWRVREYEKSIKYSLKAIDVLNSSKVDFQDYYKMTCYNTVALSYHRLGQYDSAFQYYEKALVKQHIIHTAGWDGIISGNMAQIYYAQGKYATALPLFMMDYRISKEKEFYDNAANSLQWAAKTNLALGNKDTALRQVKEAFQLLKKWPSRNYLQNAYNTASEIFKSLGNNDSAFYYGVKYNKLHDSLEKMIYQSSISISKLRLKEETNSFNIRRLKREQHEQVQVRNIIIASILFLSIIALLLINGQRLKTKYKQNLAEKEKISAQQQTLLTQHEMESASIQLKMFTENIIEKTNLVEKLQQQLKNRSISFDEQQLISELSLQTILTEEDWDNFKLLFEKIFPMFFQRLKIISPDITVAEQRMAALTRLQLTTRQMASMVGISVDSVHKTRQRLRKRFNLGADDKMEQYISGI